MAASTTTTTASLVPSATTMPLSPDQKPNLQSQFKASIPAIIFVTCTIGGVSLIILIGLLLVNWRKKGKERLEQESHEQWLARQNLEREETRVERMAFGGWFGRADDGSLPGARTRMSYAEQAGMELGHMQNGRQYG